jgi:hypothetical protein
VAALKRKDEILTLLYEMSTALSSVFTLDIIFEKAADILLRVTPADRVLVLLTEPGTTPAGGEPQFKVAVMKVRDPALEAKATKTTIGRTITRKVMRERAALRPRRGRRPEPRRGVDPLPGGSTTRAAHRRRDGPRRALRPGLTRSPVQPGRSSGHGRRGADRDGRGERALADGRPREQVARATYGRFPPDYVVKKSENPRPSSSAA